MPAGRPSPALFELLRGDTGTRQAVIRQTAPPPSAPPASMPLPSAPRPMPVPINPEPVQRPPAATAKAPAFDLQKPIVLSPTTFWLSIGAIIVVFVVTWGIAYNSGFNKGEQPWLKDLNRSSITEPLRSGPETIPVNPDLVASTPAPRQAVPQPNPLPTSGAGGDPRVAGMNYLVLSFKIDRESAERAIAFFAQNNVRLFAVAKPGGSANNPASYTLYALPGLSREEYRSRTQARTDLEEAVARLGKIWQKDHKGQTNFATTQWEKFGT